MSRRVEYAESNLDQRTRGLRYLAGKRLSPIIAAMRGPACTASTEQPSSPVSNRTSATAGRVQKRNKRLAGGVGEKSSAWVLTEMSRRREPRIRVKADCL